MRNSGDTYAKHLLPNQADEHLDSKVTSLYYCTLYILFLKEQFCHGEKTCGIVILEKVFVVLRICLEG